jgi:hypothetical protein
MPRRLTSRCKDFLEFVDWHSEQDSIPSKGQSWLSSVHTCCRLTTLQIPRLDGSTGLQESSWNPNQSGTAFSRAPRTTLLVQTDTGQMAMGVLKMNIDPKIEKWSYSMWCVKYALRMEKRLHVCPVEYLDEPDSAARLAIDLYWDEDFVTYVSRYTRTPDLRTFLDFAAWVGLPSYVSAKARNLTRVQLQRAENFKDCPGGITTRARIHENKMLLLNRKKLTGDREEESILQETESVFDNAIRSKKKGERRARWDRAKRRFFRKKRYP